MEENEVKNNVQITEDAIAVIVRMAVKEVDGVSKIALGLGGGISEALGKQNVGKGVKAEITDGNVKMFQVMAGMEVNGKEMLIL